MKLVIITGPQAVGKMAVGMALAEKTGLRLFHNHMTIELVKDIYGELTPDAWRLIGKMREDIFDSITRSDLKGVIFTYVWAFNVASEYVYINNVISKFESVGAEAIIIELTTDLETRIARNKTPLRLHHKASKRDIEWSENEMRECLDKYRLNSEDGEITHENYLKIDNTTLSTDDVAEMIIDAFDL